MSSIKTKRMLLICYEYGPHNHTGAFRWKSFCAHLNQLGWIIDVVAADSTHGSPDKLAGAKLHTVSPRYSIHDWRKRREKRYLESADDSQNIVDSGDAANGVKIRAAGQPLSLKEHLRGFCTGVLDLLDAWVWASRARQTASNICEQQTFDLVIATSPLHQTQLVAAYLSDKYGIPYIADYRDPWYFGRGPERVRLDLASRYWWRRQELYALSRATAVVEIAGGVGRGSINELAAEGIVHARIPRYLIPSGYEESVIKAAAVDTEKFRIAYIGWLWSFMPLPSLLSAVSAVCRRHPEVEKRLVVELIGVDNGFAGVSLRSLLRFHQIESQGEISQRITQDKAREKMESAAVLVAFDSVCAHPICIPSKIYHYARCNGDILAIGGTGGSMAEELKKIDVLTIDPENEARIADRILEIYSRWQDHKLNKISDENGVLAVRHRVEEMNELLNVVAFGTEESKRLLQLKFKATL